LRYVPKIGPFKSLAFNNPTAQTEDLYFKSINTTIDQYRIYLQQVRVGSLQLTNCDFDSGKETKAAEYSLTDETFAKLLGQLAEKKFDRTSPQLRDNILNFYSDLSLPQETKKNAARWQNILSSLDQLKLATPAPILAGGRVATLMGTQRHFGISADLPRGLHVNSSFCKQTSNVSSNVQTQRSKAPIMSFTRNLESDLRMRHKRSKHRFLVRLELQCFGRFSRC
jgi:hypothetical protein